MGSWGVIGRLLKCFSNSNAYRRGFGSAFLFGHLEYHIRHSVPCELPGNRSEKYGKPVARIQRGTRLKAQGARPEAFQPECWNSGIMECWETVRFRMQDAGNLFLLYRGSWILDLNSLSSDLWVPHLAAGCPLRTARWNLSSVVCHLYPASCILDLTSCLLSPVFSIRNSQLPWAASCPLPPVFPRSIISLFHYSNIWV